MNKLMKIEMIKLKKSMAFKIIGALIIFTVVTNLAVYGFVKLARIEEVNAMFETMGMDLTGYGTYMLYVSNMLDTLMFTVILMCILIGGDFSSRTLQGEITAGYSRSKVAISRLFTMIIVFFVYSVLYLGLYTIGMTIIFGFGKTFTIGVLGELLLRYLLCIMANIAMLSIYWLIPFIFKSTGVSIGISLPILLFGTNIITIIGNYFEMAGKIISWTAFGIISLPGTVEIEAMDVVRAAVVVAVTLAVTIAVNLSLFKKSELK